MKKFLSLIMALVMVGTLTSTALAANYKDVDKDYKNYNAIEVLDTLGVIHGFNENIFGPEGELTRAQLCAMLVRAFYGEYDFHFNNTTFKDVPLNHWARVYIDTAVTYGLMNGYSKDYFGPEDKLTYTQAARVILNALGYGKLDWPHGVNLIAYELGLYNNIHGVILDNGVCTRAHAAQMIYNAFNCKLVEEYSDSYFATDNNFLNDLLGYKETEINNNGRVYLAYKDMANKILATDIELSYELNLKINTNGENYRIEGSKQEYPIIWDEVTLYVDNELSNKTSDLKKKVIANSKVIGVFDKDTDELISIFFTSPAEISYPGNRDEIPNELKKMLRHDKNFIENISTVTYWADNTYIISNNIEQDFIKESIDTGELDNKHHILEITLNNGFNCELIRQISTDLQTSSFIRIFIDHENNPVGYLTIKNPGE